MNALERITAILERARIAGGWVDEDVAAAVLKELELDECGLWVPQESKSPDTENV